MPTTAAAGDDSPARVDARAFRAGFVALLGLPNVGKSTLLNGLVEARLAIVTPRAQTTRRRLAGIYTDAGHQAIFLDTPGWLEPRYPLQEAMRAEAEAALQDADVVVYVADAGFEESLIEARRFRELAGRPAILCLNKADRASEEQVERLVAGFRSEGWDAVHVTVARRGIGVSELRRAALERLPESAPLYPMDELSTEPLRHFAAEFVREACFEQLGQEVPYSVAVRVDAFEERGPDRPTFVAATIFVERNSQKGIVIGAGGRRVREIGSVVRRRLKSLVGRPIYLELRVRVLPNWRKRRKYLRMLGFRARRGGKWPKEK